MADMSTFLKKKSTALNNYNEQLILCYNVKYQAECADEV